MAGTERLKVLLVDDDPLIRRGYGDRLVEAGWDVTVACDGFEAVQAARDETFDVVLLDLRMPYRDGAEVLRTLRQDPSFTQTRVFLLAQPGDADLVEQAAREGVEAVFEKARLGPRDIVAEVQARLAAPQPGSGDPAAEDAPATQNVPSEVDEIARRFRRGNRTFSGDGPPPISEDIPANVAKLIVSAQPAAPAAPVVPGPAGPSASHPGAASQPGAGSQPGAASQPGEAYESVGDHEPEPITGPTIAMSPMSVRLPPPPKIARGRDHAPAHPVPADAPPRPPAHPVPADAPPRERTITGEITGLAAPSGAGGPIPPTGEHDSFNVVLNRYVGEAVQLAHALGLPSDLQCPVCQRQLALRLMADREHEYSVSGFFYCPRCTGSG